MSLDSLRAHAHVTTSDGEVRIWLPSRRPFWAVSALVIAGSLAMEVALMVYVRQQGGSGAWAILVIVTVWLLSAMAMIRRRLRAIEQSPTLRLTEDTLSVGERSVPLSSVRGARAVEHATYTSVEIDTDDGVLPVLLGGAAQAAPLAAVITDAAR